MAAAAAVSGAWAVPGVLRPYDLVTLAGLARGRRVDEIAAAVGSPYETVRNRVLRMRQRMGAVSCAHAVAIAYRRGWLSGLAAEPRPYVWLSGRQRQVLALMADGLTNSAIAVALGISEDTASTYARRIYTAFNVSRGGITPALAARCHAIALAYQHGYLEPAPAAPARRTVA
ncbi:LuxR C-terminal-related transcriptional regulator [Streptomyces sp. NPDC058220]|uniref:helix-turn-helix transcriptional regulator n=1 Tax=Streptomyces sp. NPDC058220 TaxID=3346387 RepID=UPI0036E3328A